MRRDMVTRTVLGTKVMAKVVDPATEEITVKEIKLTGAFSAEDTAKVKKAVTKALNGEVLVKIESVEEFNKLYGVDTAQFMAIAMELDPVTRKPLATETETKTETTEE